VDGFVVDCVGRFVVRVVGGVVVRIDWVVVFGGVRVWVAAVRGGGCSCGVVAVGGRSRVVVSSAVSLAA
jgi:hypothetical protein